MRRLDWFPWVLRVAWGTLPLTAGPALGRALDPHSTAVRTTGSVIGWAAWAAGLLATLVPYPVGLTVLRALAPLAVGAAAWSKGPLAVAATIIAAAVVFAPRTGILFVNGPAYPNERRFPLRAPGALLAGLLPVAWALTVGPPLTAALLFAARQNVLAAIVAAVGVPVAAVVGRALHTLSRRWVVFVPAGVVLHDPLALADPVLFEKRKIEALHLAPADTDSLDLTQRAPGLAVELLLAEKVPMTLVRPGDRAGESGSSARLLFTPTRPGAVLAEAKARGLRQSPPPPR